MANKLFLDLPTHIVQSPEWGEFKTAMGTPAAKVGGVQFTVHRTPLLPLRFGYCPKVDVVEIDWETIGEAGQKRGCFAIRFDVPNIVKGDEKEKILQEHCQKSPRSTFARQTVFVDMTKPEEELMAKMSQKTRYNIRLAQRRGVVVEEGDDEAALEIFLELQRETAARQKFYIHSDDYYQTLWRTLRPRGMAYLLVASAAGPVAAWMLLRHKDVLYYPYGGSDYRCRQLMASNLLAWEAMRLGKRLGCKVFDMWGASDPKDKDDPWYGFTKFKLGYGGQLVKFTDSYDLVLNPLPYHLFNLGYKSFWAALDQGRFFLGPVVKAKNQISSFLASRDRC